MKITKLFAIFSFVLMSFTSHAQLYSAASLNSSGYNAGNTTRIAFEQVLFDQMLLNFNVNITISQLRIAILREAGAPAVTAKIWIARDDPSSGAFIPFSSSTWTQSFNQNGASTTTEYVTLGNGVNPFYTTGDLNTATFTELWIGVQFDNTDTRNSWQYAGLPNNPNSTAAFLNVYTVNSYIMPATSLYKLSSSFNNPQAAMGLQIFGNGGTSLLPIELAKFNATQTDKFQSTLTWQTASERNNQGFQVEKSLDGSVFKSIGFVKGVGNSNVSNDYEFRDNDFSKSAYFRLKQIDFDGKYAYSPTIYVEKSQVGKVKTLVYPNPSLGKFYVDHATDIKNITVFNLTGQAVFNQNVNEAERTEIDISNLATGLYFVRLNDNKGHIETKQVKVVSQ